MKLKDFLETSVGKTVGIHNKNVDDKGETLLFLACVLLAYHPA